MSLIADRTAARTRSGTETQVVSFRLGREEYGVPIRKVHEIIMPIAVTTLPELPDHFLGVINLRGGVVPIVDLRKRFRMATTETTANTRILIVDAGGTRIGLTVDAVDEVLRLPAADLTPPPPTVAGIGREFLQGLAQLDGRLIIVLNVDRLFQPEELLVGSN